MQYYCLNGEFVQKQESSLSVDNRGFRYGDGIFESIKVIDGIPHLMDKHLQRIETSLKVLRFSLNFNEFKQTIENHLLRLIEMNEIKAGGKARIIITRVPGGLYKPENSNCWYFIEAESQTTNAFELNSKGLQVDIYQEFKKQCNRLSNLKTLNSLTYVLAGCFVNDNNLQSCIIMNDKGSICDGLNSNVFVVVNGVIYTPSVEEACVEGVMRNKLIEICSSAGIRVYETALRPNDLIRADEVFFSNAVQGISWVGAYKSKRYFNNVSKKLNDLLNQSLSVNSEKDLQENSPK